MDLAPWRATVLPSICLAAVLVLAGCGSSSSSSKATSTPSSSSSKSLGLISPGVLTVGSDTTYPPMESKNPSNPSQAEGADIDLASALGKAMGLSGAKIVSAPFDSIITSLKDKRFDAVMSSMNHTPDRAKQVDFVDYMTASVGILVPKSSSIHANTYKALCGKTVSVERGTTELDGLTAANKTCSPKIRILSFTADTDAFQALASGHSEAYTGDFPVVRNYAFDPRFGGKYRAAGKAFATGENYGIAIRKGETALRTAFVKALAKIRANGQYKGLFLALGRLSRARVPVFRWFSGAYIWLFRGTPLLVQIIFVYFALPQLSNHALSPGVITSAIIALALNEGAYMAEIVRAGIGSVDRGQVEAAKALGMTYPLTMRRIVIPQAVRFIIPPTGNEFISMLKNTSLAYVISAPELLKSVSDIYSANFYYFELLSVACVWYLAMTTVATLAQSRLEQRLEYQSVARRTGILSFALPGAKRA